jgi:hypothetical protein
MVQQKKKELDEDIAYRPLEPHEEQALSDKRIEKIDARVSRMEGLLENIANSLKKLLGKDKCKEEQTPEECKADKKASDDRTVFLGEEHVRLTKDIDDMSKQEVVIGKNLKYRRKQDAWFALIMLDCKFKISEGNNLNCTKTGKSCNYKNCPIKDKVDEILK